MIHLLGIASFNNRHSLKNKPLENVELLDYFNNCEEKTLISSFAEIRSIYDSALPDQFSDSIYQVLVFGNCYSLLKGTKHNYNKKLSARDISTLFKEEKTKFVNYIKGSFSIAIIDLAQKKLHIFTDPLNLKSIYFLYNDEVLYFSSSLSILSAYLKKYNKLPGINYLSFIEHLIFGYSFEERTIIKNISLVPPASQLTYSEDGMTLDYYKDAFNFFAVPDKLASEKEGIEQTNRLFMDNIKLYTSNIKNTSVAITGGYDSRAIVSCLGERIAAFDYFSYGTENSWDITIPQTISHKLNISYRPIYLNEKFEESFSESANKAILLGDGIGEFGQANIAYVYSNFFDDKRAILTGLFGSELIKNPTSIGYFINQNVYNLLFAEKPIDKLNFMLENAIKRGLLTHEMVSENKEGLVNAIANTTLINNDLPKNEKLFFYLLMLGIRKYFAKEIKIQQNWVDNIHPFYDVEFIHQLLTTPFPWVHHYTRKKSLVNNLSIHKLYAHLINKNDILINEISTHGFRPKYLLKKRYLPLLTAEYLRYKKVINRESNIDLKGLIDKEIGHYKRMMTKNSSHYLNEIINNKQLTTKEKSTIVSVQVWLNSLGYHL